MTKIVIADDHPLLLDGLFNQLTSLGFTAVSKANNGNEAFQLIKEIQPDIAILDIEMPFIDGLSIAKQCREENIATKFIILTYHQEAQFILKAKKLNIDGYILKEDAISELEICINNILNGDVYYSKVFRSKNISDTENTLSRITLLSPSELKILKLIAQNISTKEISELLFISERTVEKHRSNIISKLKLGGKPNVLNDWVMSNKSLLKIT